MASVDNVVFDLGGVLIEWNPRHLYRKLIDDEAVMERFLAEVCTPAWNERQDEGRPIAEATAELVAAHPDQAELIRAFYGRWEEMMPGLVPGTLDLLEQVRAAGRRVFALSNWSAETFPFAEARFGFLGTHFEGRVISGHEGVKKPDRRIYDLLIERYALDPGRTLFIDDVERNAEAARAAGWQAIWFRDAAQAARELARLGVL